MLSYYFKYPQKVKGLILCGTGARLRVSPVIFQYIKEGFDEYIKYAPSFAFHRKTAKHIIDDAMEQVSKIDPQVLYTDFSICNEFDVMEKIRTINIPCLILCGIADKLTPVKYSQFFVDKIKSSTLEIIKESGHMVMVEKPEKVNQLIRDFIENKV